MRFFLCLFFFIPAVVQAGFLRLVSDPNIRLQEKKGEMYLEGQFTLENQGNEAAKDVYPSFSIDLFRVDLAKRYLQAGEKFTWNVSERIPRDQLCLEPKPLCPTAMSEAGDFLIRIDKNYQDQNGYPFSAPDLLSLSYKKDFASRNAFDLVEVEITIRQLDDRIYIARYKLRSTADHPMRWQLRYLLPKEVDVLTPEIPIELGPHKEIEGQFRFRNRTGLEGSHYLTMLVAQGNKDDQRLFSWVSTHFRIQKFTPRSSPSIWPETWTAPRIFVAAWVLLSVLALFLVYWFWQRPLKKLL